MSSTGINIALKIILDLDLLLAPVLFSNNSSVFSTRIQPACAKIIYEACLKLTSNSNLGGAPPMPPITIALFIGLQHLLAVFGGIVTAPLIVAMAMNLSAEDTGYFVSSALVISGVATIIQVRKFGPLGSGLLSIQGTSFTFIGPLIYSYYMLLESHSSSEALGVILGSCAACSLCMILLSQFVDKLQRFVTANVTGTTVILIGLSLIWTTLKNIQQETTQVESNGESAWLVIGLASLVFIVTLALSFSGNKLAKISSVTVGLVIGFVVANLFGLVDYSSLKEIDLFFYPIVTQFPIGFDIVVFLILMPIFIISSTETLGDLTATSSLSGFTVGDKNYWRRIKGGITGDAFNSFLAAIFCTFPNTSFSQNNGVIRLTGISNPKVGIMVGCMLCALGVFPVVGALLIILPGAVLYGATMLMFLMVLVSGVNIVKQGDDERKSWPLVAIAVSIGITTSFIAPQLNLLPQWLITLIQFPISTGAFAALFLQLVWSKIPRSVEKSV